MSRQPLAHTPGMPLCELVKQPTSGQPSIAKFCQINQKSSDPRNSILASLQSPIKKAPQRNQTYLNVGQNLFRSCAQCGMSFNSADPKDVRLHKRFHARAIHGIRLAPSDSFPVLAATLVADCTLLVLCLRKDKAGKRDVSKAGTIRAFVNTELGACDEDEAASTASFYLVGGPETALVGYVSLLRITEAFPLCEDSKGSDYVELSKSAPKAIGVNRIWLHPEHRRKRLGSFLLKTALAYLKISASQIAFSQPTEAGKQFARAFTADAQLWVYLRSAK